MHSAWGRALWKHLGPLLTRILELAKQVAVWPAEVFHGLFPASVVQKARGQVYSNAPQALPSSLQQLYSPGVATGLCCWPAPPSQSPYLPSWKLPGR